jgi:hypothetical protein
MTTAASIPFEITTHFGGCHRRTKLWIGQTAIPSKRQDQNKSSIFAISENFHYYSVQRNEPILGAKELIFMENSPQCGTKAHSLKVGTEILSKAREVGPSRFKEP